METIYSLYACEPSYEADGEPPPRLVLMTTDRDTLLTAIAGEILVSNMMYQNLSGGAGFSLFKKDYALNRVDLQSVSLGYVEEQDNASLKNRLTMETHHLDAQTYLNPEFDFSIISGCFVDVLNDWKIPDSERGNSAMFRYDCDFAESIQQDYPAGTKVVLDRKAVPYRDMPPGLKGIVNYVDGGGMIHCTCENGSSLALVPGEDSVHKDMTPDAELSGDDAGQDLER